MFIVLKSDTNVTEDEIIKVAKTNLALDQKSRSVEFIDELPKPPTGKSLKLILQDSYCVDQERGV